MYIPSLLPLFTLIGSVFPRCVFRRLLVAIMWVFRFHSFSPYVRKLPLLLTTFVFPIPIPFLLSPSNVAATGPQQDSENCIEMDGWIAKKGIGIG